jgi:LmbE family N-acetylglucosaminyl deacetylase
MRALVITPHPDDEVLGCGGTIAKFSANGWEVHNCIVTEAYLPDWSEDFIRSRMKEIEAANKILGVKKTHFLSFPAAKLDTVLHKELNESISGVVNEVTPDVVFIPHRGDLHMDHRLVFESSLVALRPLSCNATKVLSYETLSETEWGWATSPFTPNIYVDISSTIGQKIEAMKAYGSEVKQPPHPRSFDVIEYLARKRGSEIGVKFAETFMLIREILK